MPTPSPTAVVCAIIAREGRILLAQRPPGKRLAGLWEFPGGKIEPDESAEAALHRELAEELSCLVRILRRGPPVLHTYPWGTVELHPFVCELADPVREPVAHEHSALQWVEKTALLGFDLAPADVPIVEWLQADILKLQS